MFRDRFPPPQEKQLSMKIAELQQKVQHCLWKRQPGTSLVVQNPPSNAGDTGSIPGWGTKIPHAAGQLRPQATTREPAHHNYWAHVPQLEKHAHCNEDPAQLNKQTKIKIMPNL